MKLAAITGAILLTGAIANGAGRGPAWTAMNAGIASASFGIMRLTVDPTTPATLYAVTNNGRIFKTADAAGTWTSVSGVVDVNSLSIDPQNSSTIYASSRHGIFKSTDGGGRWNPINDGLTSMAASSLAVDPVTSSTLYGVIGGGLFKSTDGGGSWMAIQTLPIPSGTLGSLTIDPITPSTIYAVNFNGAILKSTDGGANWKSLKDVQNVGFGDVLQLTIDPLTPSTLYAGSFAAFVGPVPPAVFADGKGTISKSTDGGQTWTVLRAGIPSGAFVRSLVVDPAVSSTIYASFSSDNGAGIIKSLDGGQSWNVANTFSQNLPSSFVTVARGSPSMIYAAYSNNSPGAGSLFRSADAGATWNPANTGLDYIDLRVLAFDPFHPGTVYTGGAGGVYRSMDAGASWSGLNAFQVPASPPFNLGNGIVRSLLIDSTNPSNLYADVTRLGGCTIDDRLIFQSTDGGVNWSNSTSPSSSGCVVSGLLGRSGGFMTMDPIDPNVLYLEESDDGDGVATLLKSTDGGGTWNSFWSTQISGVNALLIDPTHPATLYAGVGDQNVTDLGPSGTGLFKSTDSGATWNYAGMEKNAVTVLAMDPADSSILYAATEGIYTAPAGFRGLFKSTDGGADWTAINNGLAGLTNVGATITALVVSPGHSNILYAATSGDGVYESADSGATWSRFNDGLQSLDVRSLGFAPGSQNTLYAATATGIFKIASERPANHAGRHR